MRWSQVVVYAFNPSIQEAESDGSVKFQDNQDHTETLSQKPKINEEMGWQSQVFYTEMCQQCSQHPLYHRWLFLHICNSCTTQRRSDALGRESHPNCRELTSWSFQITESKHTHISYKMGWCVHRLMPILLQVPEAQQQNVANPQVKSVASAS